MANLILQYVFRMIEVLLPCWWCTPHRSCQGQMRLAISFYKFSSTELQLSQKTKYMQLHAWLWGTLISVALNGTEWASTCSLPGLLHGSLHCYCRKGGTSATPTLTVQKTFSYSKANKFHALALFMEWSKCTVKTTQRSPFFLEACMPKAVSSSLSCSPPPVSSR